MEEQCSTVIFMLCECYPVDACYLLRIVLTHSSCHWWYLVPLFWLLVVGISVLKVRGPAKPRLIYLVRSTSDWCEAYKVRCLTCYRWAEYVLVCSEHHTHSQDDQALCLRLSLEHAAPRNVSLCLNGDGIGKDMRASDSSVSLFLCVT